MTPEERKALVGEVVGGEAAPAPAAVSSGGPVGPGESAARGALQGLSAGWGDEAAGALAAALPFTDPEAAKGETFGERRKNATDFYRGRNAAAEKENPKTYLGGQIAGGVVGAGKVGSGVGAVLKSAGTGLAAGSGYSEADEAIGLLRDTALGGALGLGGHALGSAAGKVFGWVAGKGRALAGAARGKAASQAAEEVAAQVASARGQLGAETQKGSRYVENLMRLHDGMSPEQKAAYALLVEKGVVPDLTQAVAQGTLDALPEQAGTIASKRAALDALTAEAPSLAAKRTGQLLTPQKAADLRSFLKSYAEPLAWGAAGYGIGDALDLSPGAKAGLGTVAGAIGGRTRAGKALMTRLNRPGNQLQFAEALQRAAENGSPLAKRLLQLSAPAAGVSMLTREEEGP